MAEITSAPQPVTSSYVRKATTTGREEQLVELAAKGLTDRQIATELGISRDTVASYWRRILLKFGASNRTEVVARCVERTAVEVTEDNAELRKEISARAVMQARELAQRNLLSAIMTASTTFISGEASLKSILDNLLSEVLLLTTSHYGFIGEVIVEDGVPHLQTISMTDVSWNAETSALYQRHLREGLQFRNLKTLFGEVMTTGQVVISNNPKEDPRRSGIPEGHPPLECFLGLPIYSRGELVGMIGIANRPGGYDEDAVAFISPLVSTCSNMISANRAELRRREAERRLASSESLVRNLVDHIPSAVMYESPDRRVEFINANFLKCFSIPYREADLIGIDCREARTGCLPLFANPGEFIERVEQLIYDGINALNDRVPMSDGRVLERDFIVVRTEGIIRGYLWLYRGCAASETQ